MQGGVRLEQREELLQERFSPARCTPSRGAGAPRHLSVQNNGEQLVYSSCQIHLGRLLKPVSLRIAAAAYPLNAFIDSASSANNEVMIKILTCQAFTLLAYFSESARRVPGAVHLYF